MSFHKAMLGRGVLSDNAKTLADVVRRVVSADAEPTTSLDGVIKSWVTNCPHCDRIISIVPKGNK